MGSCTSGGDTDRRSRVQGLRLASRWLLLVLAPLFAVSCAHRPGAVGGKPAASHLLKVSITDSVWESDPEREAAAILYRRDGPRRMEPLRWGCSTSTPPADGREPRADDGAYWGRCGSGGKIVISAGGDATLVLLPSDCEKPQWMTGAYTAPPRTAAPPHPRRLRVLAEGGPEFGRASVEVFTVPLPRVEPFSIRRRHPLRLSWRPGGADLVRIALTWGDDTTPPYFARITCLTRDTGSLSVPAGLLDVIPPGAPGAVEMKFQHVNRRSIAVGEHDLFEVEVSSTLVRRGLPIED